MLQVNFGEIMYLTRCLMIVVQCSASENDPSVTVWRYVGTGFIYGESLNGERATLDVPRVAG